MKKVRRLLSCAAAICMLGSAAQALEPALDPLPDLSAYPTRLLVDGRAVEEGALPRYLEGGVLLPLRNILEQAGYAVDWDARARGAVFSAEGSGEYLLDPATGDLTLKGARLWTDPAAVVLDGVTYVSAELFDYVEGVAADWDGATNTAVVVTDEPRDNVYCYDLGEGVLTQGKREIPYRMQGVIGVPEGEDRPVVILLHGAHPIRSAAENRYDLGFSYLVDQLADAGYLALSMNVGINYSFENGEPMGCERTVQVVEQQSDLLRRAIEGETGIFPCDLKNKGDLDRVILVGHSRAGYDIFEVAARAEGLGVQGLVSAAPALVSPLSCELADVPVGITIPQYDGDVTSLDGGTLFDQLEHTPQRSSGTDLIYLKNGNHGGFSTALVRPDPFADRETLPLVMEPERQQAFFGAYMLDFLESVLETGKNPLEAEPTLEGMYGDFPVMLRVDAGGTVLYQASGDSVKALETSGVAAEAENACSTLDHTAEAFRNLNTYSTRKDDVINAVSDTMKKRNGVIDNFARVAGSRLKVRLDARKLREGDRGEFGKFETALRSMEERRNTYETGLRQAGGHAGKSVSFPASGNFKTPTQTVVGAVGALKNRYNTTARKLDEANRTIRTRDNTIRQRDGVISNLRKTLARKDGQLNDLKRALGIDVSQELPTCMTM